jgi:hypothetical protein
MRPTAVCSSDGAAPLRHIFFLDGVRTGQLAHHSRLEHLTPIRHPGHRRTTNQQRTNPASRCYANNPIVPALSRFETADLGPGRGIVFHTEEVFADVGPELFEDVSARGDDGLCGEVLSRLAEAAFGGGVVEV